MEQPTYYGYDNPLEGLPLWEQHYYADDDAGMEYWLMRTEDDAKGWILGACHEDVGLMRYWGGERDELCRFVGAPFNEWTWLGAE